MQHAWTIANGLQCAQEQHCREKTSLKERERVETTAVVQEVMVETWEYDDEDHVFVFGHEVSADVQRHEKHSRKGGASRSACRFGCVSVLTTRGTPPPLSPIAGSSSGQRGYKKVHWNERGLNTLVESSRLVLVMSVLSLEMHGTSVTFICSDDYDPSRQPRPLRQSSGVSLLTDQTRSGTCWVRANWRVIVEGNSSVNKLAGVFLLQSTVQEGGATSSTDLADPVTDSTEVDKTSKESMSVE